MHGNGPNAVESKIGYLLLGLLSPHANDETIEALHVGISPLPTSDNSKQFWNVDLTSKLPSCSSELRIAEYIDYSVHRQPDGLCVVKFPWKPNHPYLPSNRGICKSRTRSVANKLSQTPGQLKTYGSIIAQQLTHGFIEKVTKSDLPKHCHFIPHHVVKKDSTTTLQLSTVATPSLLE